ncbi:MAG: helix-turn-helix domain-containing protein [Lachnospiraceae bacterium]|nr:helix-turn-helix domain-containing protein [Lachnospiraceae bacterium]
MNIDEELLSEKMQMANMVKRIREYANISQRDLSKMTGITQADISKIERGIANPSLNTIARIMSATGNSLALDYYVPSQNVLFEAWKKKANPELALLIEESANRVRQSLGDSVEKVILYGSCARGDNTDDSDVDIAILLNVDDGNAIYGMTLSEISADLLDKYRELVNFVCLSVKEFAQKKSWYPFYKNISTEGIII